MATSSLALGQRCLLVALSLAMLLVKPSFALAIANLKPNVTNAEIMAICARTDSPPFCFRVLTNQTLTHLQGNRTNLPGLAQLSVELAIDGAEQAQATVSPLIEEAKNYTDREGFEVCSQNYEQAISALKNARWMLTKLEYRGVRVQALQSLEEAVACEVDVRIPPSNPSPFQEKNKNFKLYCNIVLAIANRLIALNN